MRPGCWDKSRDPKEMLGSGQQRAASMAWADHPLDGRLLEESIPCSRVSCNEVNLRNAREKGKLL